MDRAKAWLWTWSLETTIVWEERASKSSDQCTPQFFFLSVVSNKKLKQEARIPGQLTQRCFCLSWKLLKVSSVFTSFSLSVSSVVLRLFCPVSFALSISHCFLFESDNNIRVLVRVRPPNERETAISFRSCLQTNGQTLSLLTSPPKVFTFDYVADEKTTQVRSSLCSVSWNSWISVSSPGDYFHSSWNPHHRCMLARMYI